MSSPDDFSSKVRAYISNRAESLLSRAFESQSEQLENLMILQGRALALQVAARSPLTNFRDAEFKVFSQFGEDGILQYLIREVGITRDETRFVEFGVQDYSESNTRFLLMNDNWSGMIIDGSKEFMDGVRQKRLYWRHHLVAVDAWIDRDNINELITKAGFNGDIGLLSVDIDGNDYWVWERITAVNPVIVVAEYNGLFGDQHAVSVPYDPMFERQKAHFTNLFWGTSISALTYLAGRKGYALVGGNSAGNNIFFVRKDRLGRLVEMSVAEAYAEPRFREARDKEGNLSYLDLKGRRAEIADIPVTEVKSGATTTLRELDSGQFSRRGQVEASSK